MVLDLGTVISVEDGVVRASGLQGVSAGETVKIGEVYGYFGAFQSSLS